jgi:hypothetical protein
MLTAEDSARKVWRYMSYARFVWMLQKKELWLSRANRLSDNWEISLAGDQLQRVIDHHPISPIEGPRSETALARAARIIKLWRDRSYINCWSAQSHESHALWCVYCPTSEGVAIQTTLGKLTGSVGLPVVEVAYVVAGTSTKTPTIEELSATKRPMFAYEQEVRVINFADSNASSFPPGFGLPWECDKYVEAVLVHPEADQSFMDTVKTTVSTYAPALEGKVRWSDMSAKPPF